MRKVIFNRPEMLILNISFIGSVSGSSRSTDSMTFFSRRFPSKGNMPDYSSDCFLVGAFLVKSARHLQWLVFFVRLQSHSDWATFLTIETTKTTSIRGQVRSAEISANGSPFHFLFFYRNLQNRTRLKGSIFFRHCATFFGNISMSQKSPPFEFFDILQQNVC